MKKTKSFAVITATAQGIVYHSDEESPKSKLEIYDKSYQAKNDVLSSKQQKTKNTVDNLNMNLIQRQMYRRLMYGLKSYSPEQIASMSSASIKRVVDDYSETKRAIHIIKAKKCFQGETKLLNKIFNRDIGKYNSDWYMDIPKYLTLRKLDISIKTVINELIRKRLLPKNFYELSSNTITL